MVSEKMADKNYEICVWNLQFSRQLWNKKDRISHKIQFYVNLTGKNYETCTRNLPI